MSNTIKFFEIGGCVRDEILGLPTKDVDFAVEAESFGAMRDALVAEGFKIFQEREEFVTIRAGVPEGHVLRERTKDADFVLCRKDGVSSDGRRPDSVEAGTLRDDQDRRDLTMNAIAKDPETGALIDPHGGVQDIADRLIRFVGNPEDRIREDGLRVLRAFRFAITKGFTFERWTRIALMSDLAVEMLACVSAERRREEVEKMMQADTLASLTLLSELPEAMRAAIFTDGLRLSATMKA